MMVQISDNGPAVIGAMRIGGAAEDRNGRQSSQHSIFEFLIEYLNFVYMAMIIGQVSAMIVEMGVPLLGLDLPCFHVVCHSLDWLFIALLALDIGVSSRIEGFRSYLQERESKAAVAILVFSLLALKFHRVEVIEVLPVGVLHLIRVVLQVTRAWVLHAKLQATTSMLQQGSAHETYELVEDGGVVASAVRRAETKAHLQFCSTYYVALGAFQIVGQLCTPWVSMAVSWHSGTGECTHVAMDIIDLAFIVLLFADAAVILSHIGVKGFLSKRENQLLTVLIVLSVLTLVSEATQLLGFFSSSVVQFVRSLLRFGRVFVLYRNLIRMMENRKTDTDFAACVVAVDVTL